MMNTADLNPKPSTSMESLSALADGELGADAWDGLLADIDSRPESMANWHAYQVIGDVLRGSNAVVGAQAPDDFLAGVRGRLKTEGAALVHPVLTQIPTAPALAANDSVFRWKMVAGLASVAAVMSVSWNLMGGVPPGAGGGAGPQLANAVPAQSAPSPVIPATSVARSSPSTEVAVNTGQGVVIRDARLEELLAEHRQHGGMSALQMPTGFIRGATYDASDR